MKITEVSALTLHNRETGEEVLKTYKSRVEVRDKIEYIKPPDSAIKNNGDVLAHTYYHLLYPNGKEAVGDCGATKVDNKNWDIFHIHYETEDAYYGVPMLGMGLINCMLLKEDTRPFLEEDEFEHELGVYGSHSGKDVGHFKVKIEPIVERWD